MNNLKPRETYKSLSDISLIYLKEDLGIEGLIFDFDGTITFNKKLSAENIEFIDKAKAMGFKVSVLSNNYHVSKKSLELIDVTVSRKFAFKPRKKPFLDMAKRLELNPGKIAVIGNNRISDIWGANRSGMYSIYIQNMNNYFYKKHIKKQLKKDGITTVE